jgi:hypothetical protein
MPFMESFENEAIHEGVVLIWVPVLSLLSEDKMAMLLLLTTGLL